jgi:signal transduction histidine kinase
VSDPTPHPSIERLNAVNRLTVVSRLLSSAVHDTRNALQIVSGHAEMFVHTAGDAAKAAERGRSILAQCARATDRLQTLVALVQDTGEAPAEKVDLRALAEEVLGLRKSSFGRARITARIEPETGVMCVRGRRTDLLRLVANLTLNAERAVAGRAGAEIRVGVSERDGQVVVRVADTGPGIPEDAVPQLFEPFGPGDGPGIGLAVSRWLAAQHGGTLTLAENSPAGAVFELSLPRA